MSEMVMKSKIVREFLDALRLELKSADVDDALALTRIYGNVAWNNPVGIYQADDIEDLIYLKLSRIRDAVLAEGCRQKNGKILHVLTEGYSSGGHTRVLERLVSSSVTNATQDVVIVEMCPATVVAKLKAAGADVKYVEGTGGAAVSELALMMAEYDSVVLHIHPDDIVSSLAARIAHSMGTKVALYNHADHCFTFGVRSVSVLCEISAYGRAVSRTYRQGMPWTFAGIALDVSVQPLKSRVVKDYVLSSGPGYKFDFSEDGLFSTIIERVTEESAVNIMVIGPGQLPASASKKIISLVDQGRLIITPPMSHELYSEHLHSCICYLDSAPVTGGSALPEAALLGIPCAGMINPVMGYSPVDSIRSKNVAALVARIKSLCKRAQGTPDISSEALLEVHCPDRVLERILSSLHGDATFEIPLTMDAEAIDIENIHERWNQEAEIKINTRAFDYVSFMWRIRVLRLLIAHNVIGSMKSLDVLKLLASNLRTRRLRNR